MMILGTQSQKYIDWRSKQDSSGRNNGAYWYAKEIEDIILPEMSDLNVVISTVMAGMIPRWEYPPRPIIVCHDNHSTLKSYSKLLKLGALFICSKQSVVDRLVAAGEKAVYIPLSIDTDYVAKYKRKKTKDIAYVGNPWGFKKEYLSNLPSNIVQLNNMSRADLLSEMSKYKRIIAEGRCYMEAKVLGAKVELPEDDSRRITPVDVIDSRAAIPLWREVLEAHVKTYSSQCIIKSRKQFYDLKASRNRRVNELFIVSKSRADQLLRNEHNLVEII